MLTPKRYCIEASDTEGPDPDPPAGPRLRTPQNGLSEARKTTPKAGGILRTPKAKYPPKMAGF
jgi:hypothetical protein